jgi:hypothetical protein
MNSSRRAAGIVGALFLIAMVTSLAGGIWLESMISVPDYLTTASAHDTQVLMAALLEIINGIAVIGIAVVIFSVLGRHDAVLALGYIAFRVLEAVMICAAASIPLSLVALSREYLAAGAPDVSYYQTAGTALMAGRAALAGLLIPVFFGLSALLLYTGLYQSKRVPRFISIWGFLAVGAVVTWNLLEVFGIGISWGMVLALPIMLNEIFLGIWLIVKGFDSAPLVAGSARFAAEG